MKNLTKLDSMTDNGTITLGKYTLLNKDWFFVNVLDVFFKHSEKYPQIVTPAKLNKKGEIEPLLSTSIFPIPLKTKVKITDVIKGCIIYQNGPRMVCLY